MEKKNEDVDKLKEENNELKKDLKWNIYCKDVAYKKIGKLKREVDELKRFLDEMLDPEIIAKYGKTQREGMIIGMYLIDFIKSKLN